ncbi:proton-coupled folate transporter-like [Lineus longissimus]|uniref:proton-coupled folate transporter-like n=1 Tax=Lineus longissimus TaxID=88925 RepID=UPI00315D39C1
MKLSVLPRPILDCIESGGFVAELVFLLYKTAESLSEPTVKLFLYQETCLDEYSIENEICYHLKNHPVEESHVQQLAANYIMYYKILLNLPAIILGLFCGAWSDRVGRKLPMILPCLGSIFAVLIYMLGMLPTWKTLPFIFIGATVNGMFGKSAVIAMAVHSYATDTSTNDQRTRRLGKLLSMNFFGLFFGSLLAGCLLDVLSFNAIFCIVVGINGLATLVILIFLKESVPGIEDDRERDKSKGSGTFLFNPNNIRESLMVLFCPRENNGRCHLMLLFLTVITNQICKAGEVDITMLFVERAPLGWSKSLYGYLLAVDFACLGLSLWILLPLFSNILGIKDANLVLIGLTFKISRLIFVAFSNQTWMVFASVVVGSVSGMIVSGCKSLISKTVTEAEVGKSFSLLSCGETASNLVGAIIFTNIYSATFEIFPGFTFIVEAFIFIALLVMFVWLARDIKASERYRLLESVSGQTSYGTEMNPNTQEPHGDSTDIPESVQKDNLTVEKFEFPPDLEHDDPVAEKGRATRMSTLSEEEDSSLKQE